MIEFTAFLSQILLNNLQQQTTVDTLSTDHPHQSTIHVHGPDHPNPHPHPHASIDLLDTLPIVTFIHCSPITTYAAAPLFLHWKATICVIRVNNHSTRTQTIDYHAECGILTTNHPSRIISTSNITR
jgi:hypothetical protein